MSTSTSKMMMLLLPLILGVHAIVNMTSVIVFTTVDVEAATIVSNTSQPAPSTTTAHDITVPAIPATESTMTSLSHPNLNIRLNSTNGSTTTSHSSVSQTSTNTATSNIRITVPLTSSRDIVKVSTIAYRPSIFANSSSYTISRVYVGMVHKFTSLTVLLTSSEATTAMLSSTRLSSSLPASSISTPLITPNIVLVSAVETAKRSSGTEQSSVSLASTPLYSIPLLLARSPKVPRSEADATTTITAPDSSTTLMVILNPTWTSDLSIIPTTAVSTTFELPSGRVIPHPSTTTYSSESKDAAGAKVICQDTKKRVFYLFAGVLLLPIINSVLFS